MGAMTVVPPPPGQADITCASCGAALVADQRYCLACGQPASPVRLAFLDVLQAEHNGSRPNALESRSGPRTIEMGAGGYIPPAPSHGISSWPQRNSGLLALLSVLVLCLLVGLLVGHWVTQGGAPARQIVEVKGLSAGPAAAATTTPANAPTSATSSAGAGNSQAKAEAEEAKAETKETAAEKAPPPPAVKVTPAKIKKLSSTTGKKHQEEINALGAQPLETG
jgi:hypothetical protein